MLQFDDRNQFRILVVADIQDRKPLDFSRQAYLSALINRAKPHLAVLLGDILFGPGILTKEGARRVIASAVYPFDHAGVPFVFVAGNHDMDARLSLAEQIDVYRESRFCLTPRVSDRICSDAYVIDLHDEESQSVTSFLFFDSGGTRLTWTGINYDPANASQIVFTDETLAREACRRAFIFQHIPVPEIFGLVKEVPARTLSSVRGHGPYRNKYFTLAEGTIGTLGEAPCPPWQNSGQFDGWVRSGKIKAAFFGHDHKNSFLGDVNQVQLIHTACAGLSCYGTDALRGGRLVIINRDGSFRTDALFYKDLMANPQNN